MHSAAQLRYFHEVARQGSIRRAAEGLHVASSAISRQILRLEEEVGTPLFERRARGMILTSAGRIYAQYALDAIQRLEQVQSQLDELRDLRMGHIEIYSIEGMVADFLSEAVAAFRHQYPGVGFRLTVAGTDQVASAVREGEADIGVAFKADPHDDLTFAFRIKDPLRVVMAPSYPLATSKPLDLAQVFHHPIAIPAETFGIRHLIDLECKALNHHLRPALETNSIEAL
jgi:DNA-binding transcriptional LysR family regulator